ncbi:leucyl aminopeptidase [Subtercola frigoramans]|uniref:Probable cytosol aminopeptidase n=1 Tax=Subtercola frigoramans TaxID=120298 RepID=A0ABS2L4R1_9MICO|nr:leucyl aminopeptidase [Subtercola frigoramans]MBM7472088.1 leucyl aminopeptidase [Subtercola frigoramans]
MTLPEISVAESPAHDLDADVLVLAAGRTDDRLFLLGSEELPAGVTDSIESMFDGLGFTGKKDEVVRMPSVEGIRAKVIVVVGLGQAGPTTESLRYAAGVATRRIRGFASFVLALPVTGAADVRAVLEGAALGAYSYLAYRKASLDARQLGANFLVVPTTLEGTEAAATEARETARAVYLVRDLVNEAPLDLYPESLVDRARSAAEGLPVSLKVWEVAELEAEGFGGILGVGQGSTRGPRLVRVSYEPTVSSSHLALVGKGITFDSGGLSLKPPGSMIGMKNDMTGSATVLAVTLAAAALSLPVRITAWLCLAENMPSGSAIRPGDVLTIHGGRTVEVLNTDAEGRLVLADGLVAASEEHPDAIIDVATLTGASVTALGNRYVGTLGDDDLVNTVIESAKAVGETLWPMPIPSEFRPMLNSDIADLQNIKPGNTAGGMLIAAAFLREFVGKAADGEAQIPWAHLDIAGPAVNGGEGYGFTPKGPTGVTVRTLLDVAEKLARASE